MKIVPFGRPKLLLEERLRPFKVTRILQKEVSEVSEVDDPVGRLAARLGVCCTLTVRGQSFVDSTGPG